MSARVDPALRTAVKAAAIAAAGAFAFAPAMRGGWLWDDASAIGENPILRDPAGLWKIWSGQGGQDYFPLTTSVQWAQWHLWQGSVAGYHATNVALHILSALLLWRVLRRLGCGAAWLGGLLFAVHPLVVESVAWMSELKNTLSLPPLLLAALAYLNFDKARGLSPAGCLSPTSSHPPPNAWGWYLSSLALFTIAMLCKSSVVMFPAVLLLYAWWRRGRVGWRDLAEDAPFFAVSLVLGLITVQFQTARAMAHVPMPAEGLAGRIGSAGPAAVFYLAKAVLPLNLMPIYPDGPFAWWVLAWCAIAAGAGVCWAKRTSWGRHALFGFGFFFLNLLPVLGIVPMAYLRISRVSDHFAYLPLVGLIGLVAAAAGRWRATARPVLFWACAALAVAACISASRNYAGVFRSEETLWVYALERNPGAWLAHNNLGIVLAKSGRFDEAIAHGEEAVRLRPGFAEARSNLGLTLTEARRLPEAIGQLTEAVRLNPDLAGARLNLGRALLAAGRAQEAVMQLEQLLRLEPASPEARRNLAIARNNYGNALARAGRLPEAVAEFQRALQLDPGNAGTHRNLGHALQAMGDARGAEAEFAEADRLDQNR
jgi:tetratricopeptide (TPR) repeat protein